MICTIDGKQFEFPESELIETQVTGIALVGSGVVTEEDIANADKDAISDFQMLPINSGAKLMQLQLEQLAGRTAPSLLQRHEKVLVRSSRMYFELSDRTVSLPPPLGHPASHIECYWLFAWVPRAVLQSIEPGFGKGKLAGEPSRICFVEGKQCCIPAELIAKLTSIFMVGITGSHVTESDIARLDTYVNEEFDKYIAQSPSRVEIQRMRLYFQFPDGTITQELPIGRQDRSIACCTLLQSVPRERVSAVCKAC